MMAESEVAALKEALRKQTLIVNGLHAELEKERNAGESGVREALSMIMRLQEEKAAARMEARHHRRMADEKIQHAEESMSALKEIIFQKEMEIQSLRYQVHSYKEKLSLMGLNIQVEEIKMNYYSSPRILDRNISLPAVRLEELSSEADIASKFSSFFRNIHGQSDTNFSEQLNNYVSTKIQLLLKPPRLQPSHSNEKFPQLVLSGKCIGSRSLSNGKAESDWKLAGDPCHLRYLNLNGNSLGSLSQAREARKRLKYGSSNHCVLRTRSDGEALYSMDIQDIYEIRDCQDGHDLGETPKDLFQECLSETRLTGKETFGYLECHNQPLTSTGYGKEPSRQLEDVSGTCPLISGEPKYRVCPYPTESIQLKEMIQWLEEYIKNMSEEDLRRDAEELKLLKSLIKQLDKTSSHLTKPKNHCNQEDDTMFQYLVEAMLSFSI